MDTVETLRPSGARERIAIGVGVALLVAGLILVMFVLPAEFAVDPLGTGARTGLLQLGETGRQIEAFTASAGTTGSVAVVTPQDRGFQEEVREFSIAPGSSMEYKYRLDKGEALLFSWTATGAVEYEFHAEPDGAPDGFAETYEKGQGSEKASGTLTAPFAGIHGWYWDNKGSAPVVVRLTSAGFYNMSHEFQPGQPVQTKMFN